LIPSNASGKRGLQKVIELTCVRECIAVWKPLVGVVRGLEVRYGPKTSEEMLCIRRGLHFGRNLKRRKANVLSRIYERSKDSLKIGYEYSQKLLVKREGVGGEVLEARRGIGRDDEVVASGSAQ